MQLNALDEIKLELWVHVGWLSLRKKTLLIIGFSHFQSSKQIRPSDDITSPAQSEIWILLRVFFFIQTKFKSWM